MFKRRVEDDIAAIEREQHGLIAHRQLHELRLSAKQVRGGVAAGRWECVLPGVLRLAGAPPTAEQELAAAVLWGGPTSVASYRSAARLWELDVPEGARPEITVPVKT